MKQLDFLKPGERVVLLRDEDTRHLKGMIGRVVSAWHPTKDDYTVTIDTSGSSIFVKHDQLERAHTNEPEVTGPVARSWWQRFKRTWLSNGGYCPECGGEIQYYDADENYSRMEKCVECGFKQQFVVEY